MAYICLKKNSSYKKELLGGIMVTGCVRNFLTICGLISLLSACGPNNTDLMTLLNSKNELMSWVKFCGDIPGQKLPGEGKNVCWTKYERISPKTKKVVFFAGVKMAPKVNKQKLVFAVPPGVNMKRGMRIKFDDEDPIPVNYSFCSARACIAQVPLTKNMLISLKHRKRMIVAVMRSDNKAYGFKVPLYRFTYAYNSRFIKKNKKIKTARKY